MYDNSYIADQFSLLAKLMDIHQENSFKIKSYSNAAYTIDKLPQQLTDIGSDKIVSIKGIGDAIGKKISEIMSTGELSLLKEYIDKTPTGIIEMMDIKGLGPKKITTIWKEMEVESIGELLYACQENRLLLYKGFGEKTQNNVLQSIEFYLKNQGTHLYAEVENYAMTITAKLQETFKGQQLSLTGEFRRQLEVINRLQWVTTISPNVLRDFFEPALTTPDSPVAAGHYPDHDTALNRPDESSLSDSPVTLTLKSAEGIELEFYCTSADTFANTLFATSCSGEFLEAWIQQTNWNTTQPYTSEEEIFSSANGTFIPSFLREDPAIWQSAGQQPLPALVQVGDIRSVIHSHSNWSDGSNTLEEMARACIEQGFEYLVISDHSKSAFYANGLKEDRIREQHLLIDELNTKLAPFRIFKSIECDILYDGALDYPDTILAGFDLVIASVHSNLKMGEDKAMMRLLNAICNPYTTILGHLTGRLLLSRPGYPVDHKRIIDACVENKVVLELNAHPRRLDIDWRWINYAMEKGVPISINPDAHSVKGYKDIKYGVLAAQKAGLTPGKNLSSFTLQQFEAFLSERKKSKGIN